MDVRATDSTAIVWFRRDLRLADNRALVAAAEQHRRVIPVYLHTPDEDGHAGPGAASRWWLHYSLHSLDNALRRIGSQLVLRSGSALSELRRLIQETGACAVYWNRRYEPDVIARDTGVKSALRNDGIEVESFNASLLREPWDVATQVGKPYQVFTPFWKACLARPLEVSVPPAPDRLEGPVRWPDSQPLDKWCLLPRIAWPAKFSEVWTPGESGAYSTLQRLLEGPIDRYATDRNWPGRVGTSRLSPHLHFGEIGPRQIWRAVQDRFQGSISEDARVYLSEIGWREFSHHILYHFPTTPELPLRSNFERFAWVTNTDQLRQWERGRTGYPIVDAGMRELWSTGWMHNRVRMIVGSFLTKHLRISWSEGARWFWDTLVDADLANNTLGWQWISGCGADAAPYFRVFNPTMQGEKFDPDGHYVRRWVPEIARLPDRYLHQPWEAPETELKSAGVVLGTTYPRPIVDHAEARQTALREFDKIKTGTA